MCLWKVLKLQIKIFIWTRLDASQQQWTGDVVKADLMSQRENLAHVSQAVSVGGIYRSKGVRHDLGIFE